MHDNGTAKQSDDRISTPETARAVRDNSVLPARAWGAASTDDVIIFSINAEQHVNDVD